MSGARHGANNKTRNWGATRDNINNKREPVTNEQNNNDNCSETRLVHNSGEIVAAFFCPYVGPGPRQRPASRQPIPPILAHPPTQARRAGPVRHATQGNGPWQRARRFRICTRTLRRWRSGACCYRPNTPSQARVCCWCRRSCPESL